MPQSLRYDRTLCAVILALTFFGLIMVFSVTAADGSPNFRYVIKQGAAAVMGLTAMRLLMFRDYREWRNQRAVFVVVGVAVVLLAAAFLFGTGANTSRFLRLGDLSLQPSELAKLALVLFLAYYLESRSERLDDWRSLAGGGLILTAFCVLVFGGRDLGTAIAMLLIAAGMLWTAGLRLRYFTLGAVAAAPVGALAAWIEPYRWRRLMIFTNPEADPQGAGFQIIQSKIAVGSGGWFGQGLMFGRQKMSFLPEAHTDFIYAVIGEEFGFVGCALVALGFVVLLWRGLRTAARAPDSFGSYLAAGVTMMLVGQAMINIGVVLAMLPTKGMPLPFISYGGTSLITCLAGAGVLLNVSQHSR